MILISIVLMLLLLFVIAVGVYGSLEITHIPYLATPYTPADFGLKFEEVTFPSFDGLTLTGWFIPADEPSLFTILIQHGMGSNAGDSLLNSLCLRNDGKWNLFYYNFRGHAESGGHQTSLGPLEVKDMDSAIAWLKRAKPEQCQRLAVYGHSMGAAVAIVGAVHHPELEAVAAESSFSSLTRTVAHFSRVYYGIPYFPFIPLALFFSSLRLGVWMGRFSPVDEIGKIAPRPLFLIHAERDLRMPMNDFEKLWAAAREPKEKWVVRGADHGEPWIVLKEEYERRLVQFFRKVFQ